MAIMLSIATLSFGLSVMPVGAPSMQSLQRSSAPSATVPNTSLRRFEQPLVGVGRRLAEGEEGADVLLLCGAKAWWAQILVNGGLVIHLSVFRNVTQRLTRTRGHHTRCGNARQPWMLHTQALAVAANDELKSSTLVAQWGSWLNLEASVKSETCTDFGLFYRGNAHYARVVVSRRQFPVHRFFRVYVHFQVHKLPHALRSVFTPSDVNLHLFPAPPQFKAPTFETLPPLVWSLEAQESSAVPSMILLISAADSGILMWIGIDVV
ncbi:hypothetical protein B0H14DRAFT_3149233 [Mycena olivaceomarginata]|nr:hypothetical protein B0H14DRAFT_3149233 [Mycena olivaceomarginata]